MNLMTSPYRKLPSADWIAVGLAALGFILGRFDFPFAALVGAGVFGPSVLRELGWLKDSDEWLRGVMHRAGFHAAVVLVPFVFLNRALPRFQHQFPEHHLEPGVWFGSSFIWQTLVLVFLVSYLLQYWGASRGVMRVLIGFGFVQLVDVARGMYGLLKSDGDMSTMPFILLSVGLVFLLAWLSRIKPRAAGITLLTITGGIMALGFLASPGLSMEMTAGLVASQVHVILIFGVTGIALLNGEKENEK